MRDADCQSDYQYITYLIKWLIMYLLSVSLNFRLVHVHVCTSMYMYMYVHVYTSMYMYVHYLYCWQNTFIFFRFAHESSFNEEQTSAFFTILHILMDNIKGDKYVTQFDTCGA